MKFALHVVALFATAALSAEDPRLPSVVVNDNRQPTGALKNGVLTLDLRAQAGVWRPEARRGEGARSEEAKAL